MMKLTIDHLHTQSHEKTTVMVANKIGKVDRYIPRHARKTAHAEVKLKDGPGRGKKQFTCEVIIHLPQQTITTKQGGETLEAAIDLAADKLKNQLKKYKDKHVLSRRHRIWRRLRRQ